MLFLKISELPIPVPECQNLSNRGLLTSLLCLGNVYVLCSSLLLAVLICVSRQCGPEGTGVDQQQDGKENRIGCR